MPMKARPRTAEYVLPARIIVHDEGRCDASTRASRGGIVARAVPLAGGHLEGGKTMRPKAIIILAALVTAAAGCHKDKNDALQNDLNLANQANSARSLDSISAAERGYAAPSPTSRTTTGTSTRSSAPARHSTSSSGAVSSAPAPSHTVVQKNTKRDAAIGAAAGAIIGATTSRDKVKGGVIGAAAGGILGGVIGNNVDVKKKKTP